MPVDDLTRSRQKSGQSQSGMASLPASRLVQSGPTSTAEVSSSQDRSVVGEPPQSNTRVEEDADRELGRAVLRLDAWLETMRGPDGYCGPVAHWWQNSLQFTGAGLDWRYEGIISGYLNLYERTGEARWLAKARRAGDDLVRGQLPSGNFRDSEFELNPYTGGTPHEAACDLALLQLAGVLRDLGDDAWQIYLRAAESNLRGYYVGRLWDDATRSFRDSPQVSSFVPNKSATLVEALLKLSSLKQDAELADRYALPTLEAVVGHQVRGGVLDGAIYQYSQDGRRIAKFFPYYVARCVPGLVAGYEWSGNERFLEVARLAMEFVIRQRHEDGSFPQVVYAGGRTNRYPEWIAGVADILRAMDLVRPYGPEADPKPTHEWMLGQQRPSGAFPTGRGLASQVSQREPGPLPELRDLLPVVGWNDKAFRYLAGKLSTGATLPEDAGSDAGSEWAVEESCTLRGKALVYRENQREMEVRGATGPVYRWVKGTSWAEVCDPNLFWM